MVYIMMDYIVLIYEKKTRLNNKLHLSRKTLEDKSLKISRNTWNINLIRMKMKTQFQL